MWHPDIIFFPFHWWARLEGQPVLCPVQNKGPPLQNKAPIQACMEKLTFIVMPAHMCTYSKLNQVVYTESGFTRKLVIDLSERDIYQGQDTQDNTEGTH